MIESIVVDFCSIECCYSGWRVWDLRTLTQFLGSEMSPGLFENFMDKRMKHQNSLYLIAAECSQVVVYAGSSAGGFQFNSCWQPIFDSRFTKFVFRNSEGMKFCSPC